MSMNSPGLITMETESENMLPFSFFLINKHTHVETKVYVKPTNTGLLLHYKSHVDDRYKSGLLKTMLDRAFRLSSNCCYFSEECDQLKLLFTRLKYPDKLVKSTLSLLPKHRINLFPHWLSAIEQTPFVLSYRLNIRPQLILYVSKSKILWNVFYSRTETCSQCAVELNSYKDFELGFYFYF